MGEGAMCIKEIRWKGQLEIVEIEGMVSRLFSSHGRTWRMFPRIETIPSRMGITLLTLSLLAAEELTAPKEGTTGCGWSFDRGREERGDWTARLQVVTAPHLHRLLPPHWLISTGVKRCTEAQHGENFETFFLISLSSNARLGSRCRASRACTPPLLLHHASVKRTVSR